MVITIVNTWQPCSSAQNFKKKIRKEGTRRWKEDVQGRKKGSVGGGQTGSGQ